MCNLRDDGEASASSWISLLTNGKAGTCSSERHALGLSFSSSLQPVRLSCGTHHPSPRDTEKTSEAEGWGMERGDGMGEGQTCETQYRWREIVENSGTKACWPGPTVHDQRGVPDQASPALSQHGAAGSPMHRAAGSRTCRPQSSFLPSVLPKSTALLARPGSLSLHQLQPCLLPLSSVPRALQTRGHSDGTLQLSTPQDCLTRPHGLHVPLTSWPPWLLAALFI